MLAPTTVWKLTFTYSSVQCDILCNCCSSVLISRNAFTDYCPDRFFFANRFFSLFFRVGSAAVMCRDSCVDYGAIIVFT